MRTGIASFFYKVSFMKHLNERIYFEKKIRILYFEKKNKNYVETWAHISASPALGPISEAGPVRHQILWLLCIFLVHFWPSLNISRNILTSLKISEHLCSSLNTSQHLSRLNISVENWSLLGIKSPYSPSLGHSLLIHTMSIPGVHFLLYVLISWADRGSCAHKCVS